MPGLPLGVYNTGSCLGYVELVKLDRNDAAATVKVGRNKRVQRKCGSLVGRRRRHHNLDYVELMKMGHG